MTTSRPGDEDARPYTTSFWIGLALGLLVIAFGVRGAVDALPGVQRTSFVQYFVGSAILHDLVVAPLVCVVAWFVVRWTPSLATGPVQAGLVTSGLVGLVSWPFVRGYGRTEGEPSFLSRDYATSVLTIWGVIWAVVALVVAARIVRARVVNGRRR